MSELAYILNQYLIFITVIAIFYLVYKSHKARLLDFIFACGLAALISECIKYVVNKPRPDASFEGSSFPSTHTSIVFAAFFFYVFCIKKPNWIPKLIHKSGGVPKTDEEKLGWGILIIVLLLLASLLVGLLRIYVGAHYLTDIIAGIMVGFVAVVPFVFYDVSGRRIK